MPTLELTTNDTLPGLSGVVSSDGEPANLTGVELIAVHIRRPDSVTLTKIADPGGDPTDGTWSFAGWDTGDLAVGGYYRVEVEVTFSNNQRQTFRRDANGQAIIFEVAPELA